MVVGLPVRGVPEPLITRKEMADLLSVHPKTVDRLTATPAAKAWVATWTRCLST